MRDIAIWYTTDLVLCNFDCEYCSTMIRRRMHDSVWAEGEKSIERFRNIIGWVTRLPYRVGIRTQTTGEPFVSTDFLKDLGKLTRNDNIRFVEMVTNGSLLKKRLHILEEHGDIEKLSFWITYHHTQIKPQPLIEAALYAQERGAFVTVNSLLFPDNIDTVQAMIAEAEKCGLKCNTDFGVNMNAAYKSRASLPALEEKADQSTQVYRGTPVGLAAELIANSNPIGRPCSAGHDYVRIDADGQVFSCAPYRNVRGGRLGSALDPNFQLQLREEKYRTCEYAGACVNKEDHMHLKIVRDVLTTKRSLGRRQGAVEQQSNDKAQRNIIEALILIANKTVGAGAYGYEDNLSKLIRNLHEHLTDADGQLPDQEGLRDAVRTYGPLRATISSEWNADYANTHIDGFLLELADHIDQNRELSPPSLTKDVIRLLSLYSKRKGKGLKRTPAEEMAESA